MSLLKLKIPDKYNIGIVSELYLNESSRNYLKSFFNIGNTKNYFKLLDTEKGKETRYMIWYYIFKSWKDYVSWDSSMFDILPWFLLICDIDFREDYNILEDEDFKNLFDSEGFWTV